jgi:opacity protein-like surface antigen
VPEGSLARRFVVVAVLALTLGAGAAAAQPMQQIAAPAPRKDTAPLEQARLSVRQGGGGDQQGLLSNMKGPAALIDINDGTGEKLRSIAGAADGPGGKKLGYVAGTGGAPLFGLDLTLNYAADETGGTAVETRLAKKLGEVRLGLSQTLNHEFESSWTGRGDTRAQRMTEGSADWSLFSVPVRLALRETDYADGQTGTDLRTLQTLQFGSGMLIQSTVTGMSGRGAGDTTGNLIYYGPVGTLKVTAELDYGVSQSLAPTSSLIGLEESIDNGWSLYAYGQQPLPTGTARVDFGAAREVGRFMAGAFGGAATDGGAYVGLRLWIPLAPGASDHRWLGFSSGFNDVAARQCRPCGD